MAEPRTCVVIGIVVAVAALAGCGTAGSQPGNPAPPGQSGPLVACFGDFTGNQSQGSAAFQWYGHDCTSEAAQMSSVLGVTVSPLTEDQFNSLGGMVKVNTNGNLITYVPMTETSGQLSWLQAEVSQLGS